MQNKDGDGNQKEGNVVSETADCDTKAIVGRPVQITIVLFFLVSAVEEIRIRLCYIKAAIVRGYVNGD